MDEQVFLWLELYSFEHTPKSSKTSFNYMDVMGGRVGASECRNPQTPEESIDCEQLNVGAENQIQVLQKSNTHS